LIGLCVLAGEGVVRLAVAAFTLGWTHSVERTAWEEDWRVTAAGLEIVEARIQGSGAGMEPPDGARLEGGWWVYAPDLPVLPELVLGASGATAAWSLCAEGECMAFGGEARPLRLWACEIE
jgi:hypothetical protein